MRFHGFALPCHLLMGYQESSVSTPTNKRAGWLRIAGDETNFPCHDFVPSLCKPAKNSERDY